MTSSRQLYFIANKQNQFLLIENRPARHQHLTLQTELRIRALKIQSSPKSHKHLKAHTLKLQRKISSQCRSIKSQLENENLSEDLILINQARDTISRGWELKEREGGLEGRDQWFQKLQDLFSVSLQWCSQKAGCSPKEHVLSGGQNRRAVRAFCLFSVEQEPWPTVPLGLQGSYPPVHFISEETEAQGGAVTDSKPRG